jgi:hypothetical protein
MSLPRIAFEMSDVFPLICEHLVTGDYSRSSCVTMGCSFDLNWLGGWQVSNRSLPLSDGANEAALPMRRHS